MYFIDPGLIRVSLILDVRWYQASAMKRTISREKVQCIRQQVPLLNSVSRARSKDDSGAFRRSLLLSRISGDGGMGLIEC